MTAEHAHALDAGGDILNDALPDVVARAYFDADGMTYFGDWLEAHDATTRQAAADAVLAEARRQCCGENPSAHHAATDKHSELMAFAGRLAGAVRTNTNQETS